MFPAALTMFSGSGPPVTLTRRSCANGDAQDGLVAILMKYKRL